MQIIKEHLIQEIKHSVFARELTVADAYGISRMEIVTDAESNAVMNVMFDTGDTLVNWGELSEDSLKALLDCFYTINPTSSSAKKENANISNKLKEAMARQSRDDFAKSIAQLATNGHVNVMTYPMSVYSVAVKLLNNS